MKNTSLLKMTTLSTVVMASALATNIHMANATEITVWISEGATEKPYFTQMGKDFNSKYKSQNMSVKLVPFRYAGASDFSSGKLPDVVTIDGPTMASFAWAGYLSPLDQFLSNKVKKNMIQGIKNQSKYSPNGKYYMTSQYDSSVVMFANKNYLKQIHARIPTSVDDAWTLSEFETILKKLKALKKVTWPLDMKLNYNGEWYTYGFAPFIQSMGGDLINRKTWRAKGTMNSPASIKALTILQNWNKAGYIVPASAGDNRFYGDKTAAISYVGNWMWPAHTKGLGKNLIVLPPVKFGDKLVSANGGYGFAVPKSHNKAHEKVISTFLNFVMSDKQVALFSDTTGYSPSISTAVPYTKHFNIKNKDGQMFYQISKKAGVTRPAFPSYPLISQAFGKAVERSLNGSDVKKELTKAARTVDEDIEDNDGYAPFSK